MNAILTHPLASEPISGSSIIVTKQKLQGILAICCTKQENSKQSTQPQNSKIFIRYRKKGTCMNEKVTILRYHLPRLKGYSKNLFTLECCAGWWQFCHNFRSAVMAGRQNGFHLNKIPHVSIFHSSIRAYYCCVGIRWVTNMNYFFLQVVRALNTR